MTSEGKVKLLAVAPMACCHLTYFFSPTWTLVMLGLASRVLWFLKPASALPPVPTCFSCFWDDDPRPTPPTLPSAAQSLQCPLPLSSGTVLGISS